ncbi:MAG: hypothetical protein K0U54_02350 [Bacteroidetes bacterium]|nr:hypothetical protein [Bacteroidota bacterium]
MKPQFLVTIIIISLSTATLQAAQESLLEGWESIPSGIYKPGDSETLGNHSLLPRSDAGIWELLDTVSEESSCWQQFTELKDRTPHSATIESAGGSQRLRLTSEDSQSNCEDDITVNLTGRIITAGRVRVSSLDIEVKEDTVIAFTETGNLIDPKPMTSPLGECEPTLECGDKVKLIVVINAIVSRELGGSTLRQYLITYVLQRAPNQSNPILPTGEFTIFLPEIYLNQNSGNYSRNLLSDLRTVTDNTIISATVQSIAFRINEHGTATLDDLYIGPSAGAPNPGAVTPVIPADPSPISISGKFSGSWYDPSHDGEGFVLEIIDNETAVVYWYTYDQSGNQIWVTGVGSYVGNTITVNEAIFTTGGIFGPNFDPNSVDRKPWGSLSLQFTSCNSSTVQYDSTAGFGSGSLQLIRLTSIDGLPC